MFQYCVSDSIGYQLVQCVIIDHRLIGGQRRWSGVMVRDGKHQQPQQIFNFSKLYARMENFFERTRGCQYYQDKANLLHT